jgi:hypothetical protein
VRYQQYKACSEKKQIYASSASLQSETKRFRQKRGVKHCVRRQGGIRANPIVEGNFKFT